MAETTTWQELKPYAYGEAAFVALACLMAALQVWSMFALLALLAVLTPLWIAAIAATVMAAKYIDDPKEPSND